MGLSTYKGIIDLPPEFDVNPLPNLGPKVNHHFRRNNCVFIEMEHPRFGLILSVIPTRDVKAGEELFADYGYQKAEFPSDFPWYWETLMEIERSERLALESKEHLLNLEKTKLTKKKRKKLKSVVKTRSISLEQK